tara:strand:+ start:636 stop:2336 length:1701 start_codon:yes stop_codon:yes gene_type:complete
MKPRLKSTEAARDLIKRFEPFLPVAERGADGRFVVGYGHRASARDGVTVDEANADLLLIYDVLQAERAIDETIGADMGAPQRDALVSFALGVGVGAFRQSATVRLIAKHRWRDAAEAIAAWGGGQSPRRAAERELFLTDLPEDADQRPVELVIEFEHGDTEPDIAAVETPDIVEDVDTSVDVDESAAPAESEAAPAESEDDDVEAVALGVADTTDSDDVQSDENVVAGEDVVADEDVAADEDVVVEDDHTAAPVAPTANFDSVTARVIARMREQIAPRRTVEPVESDDSESPSDSDDTEAASESDAVIIASFDPVLIPDDVDDDVAAASTQEPTRDESDDALDPDAALGFVFAADTVEDRSEEVLSDDGDEADDTVEDETAAEVDDTPVEDAADADDLPDAAANDTEMPPMMSGDRPAQALGATGEAGGLDAANDPAEQVELPEEDDTTPALADDLPDPQEIDPSVAEHAEAQPRNHWQNGDSSAAPAPSSGRWGTIAVFAVGLFVMIAGIVDTITKAEYYWESKSLLFGPAAAIIGGLLFSGAAIMLVSRLFAPKEVERKTAPLS